MRMMSRVAWPVLILVLAVVGAAWLVNSRPRLEPAAPQERVWTIAVAEVERRDVQPEIRLFGQVVAGRSVELRALVAGEVVDVGVTMVEGGLVRKGDLLVAIDDFEYRATLDERRAQLAEARAKLQEFQARELMQKDALVRDRELVDLREKDLKRAEQLSARGNVSDKALDNARMELTRQRQTSVMRESELRVESARIDQQKAQLLRAEVALRRAERDLKNTRLVAPFDGFLSDVQAELGQRLGLNDRVARVIDAGRLEAKVTLSDAQFGRLSQSDAALVGASAKVHWRVGGRDLSFNASVDRIGARIDTASGGVDVFVRLRDTGLDSPLRPGAFVEVSLSDKTYRNVARLPESVLHQGDTVYVVADGRLAVRIVETMARIGAEVLLSGELENGDRVVVTRYAGIGAGQKVQVR